MAFESLKPTLEVTAEDAKARLASVKEIQDSDVQMVGGKLIVRGRYKGIPVSAKAHVTAIFKALNVVNRVQAVSVARRAGLIED